MKRGFVVLSTIAVVLGAFALGRAGAQEGPDAAAKKAAEEMAAWAELAKPGPEHANLMKAVGTWTCEGKMWMGPGEPISSTGKAVFSAALGDRFIKQEYESEMAGEPFQGIGYTGFNKATRKYEMAWMDTLGTGFLNMTGTETEPGKAWTFVGSCAGPQDMEMKHRIVLKKINDDKNTMEVYCDFGTGEAKMMELTYTRSK